METFGQLVPLYPLYPLLFADHGLSDAAISALFVLWSATSLVLEVPSGAWADTFSRRRLLAGSALLAAAAFGGWVVLPTTAVFAAGFVAWGAATALASGTLEALVYDELARREATASYPRLMGRARAAGLAAMVVAALVAAPLVATGGYLLVGGVSVATGLLTAWVALGLPDPPRTGVDPDDPDADAGDPADDLADDVGAFAAWWATLRDGLSEVGRVAVVRRAVVVAAVVAGVTSVDEYLPLIAADGGLSPPAVALLFAGVGTVEVAGALLAGRCAGASPRTVAVIVVLAGATLAGGVLLPVWPGFALVAVGIGLLQLLAVVLDTRVQDAVTGRARATVTSVAGFGAEAGAITVIAAVGAGSVWFALPVVVAVLTVPLLGVAVSLVARRRSA